MIDKTCIPANRETMVLLSSVPIKRQKDHDEVNLRDDVFREKNVWRNRKCEYHRADKNVYGKKKGVHEIDHELRSAV